MTKYRKIPVNEFQEMRNDVELIISELRMLQQYMTEDNVFLAGVTFERVRDTAYSLSIDMADEFLEAVENDT